MEGCRQASTVDKHQTTSHAEELSKVNLDRIQDWINQGRLDPSKPITLYELVKSNAIHGIKDGVKLLARGATVLSTPINIVVSRASQFAISAVEKLGGTVVTRYYTKHSIRRILQRKTDPFVSLRWDSENLPIPQQPLAPGMGSDPTRKIKGNGFQYRLPDPTSRKDLEYYRDPAKRGYLSHTIKEGDSPSLFFRNPNAKVGTEKKQKKGGKKITDERLW
ncbi:putative 50s ribosomal subunit protein l15 [Phaeomoniella chlamydospora]|uniref:Putative 50s ribosomal subunit protein l15 n=1 Tax=Phaeomoniella chlamydospora TaxID=158046 RepID=A0A0G2G6P0_PHACM|nr:putative 50s ribosomal subunit protein l15 [Phaeomoniella chlamydospora]